MHYKNGREAKNGDLIVMIEGSNNVPKAGVLACATPGIDSCNGRIMAENGGFWTANLSQCLHIDDISNATIPDSTKV